ncbi:MAG: hypothetical protein OEZ13_00760 [Spirochaetia bacterium]|nr:hypothetical protein [Spirochaetia bacterium]
MSTVNCTSDGPDLTISIDSAYETSYYPFDTYVAFTVTNEGNADTGGAAIQVCWWEDPWFGAPSFGSSTYDDCTFIYDNISPGESYSYYEYFYSLYFSGTGYLIVNNDEAVSESDTGNNVSNSYNWY